MTKYFIVRAAGIVLGAVRLVHPMPRTTIWPLADHTHIGYHGLMASNPLGLDIKTPGTGASPRVLPGVLSLAICAVLWSLGGLFIKVLDWHPYAIAGLRSLIAGVVVLVWLRRPHFHWSGPQVIAAAANALTMLLFVLANKNTTAANAILLQYIAPVWTAIAGALFLKEKIRIEHFVAFVLAGAGMILLFMDKLGEGNMVGNLLAVGSSITFAIYFVAMRKQKDGSPLESTLLSHWVVAAVCLIVSLFLPVPTVTVSSVLAILVLGVFQVGVASIFFAAGIKRVSAVGSNLIAIIEPVFNPIWVFLVVGEAPGITAIIGGTIIVVAVSGASIVSARRSRGTNPR